MFKMLKTRETSLFTLNSTNSWKFKINLGKIYYSSFPLTNKFNIRKGKNEDRFVCFIKITINYLDIFKYFFIEERKTEINKICGKL